MGCTLPRTIKDEELQFDEDGLGDHRTKAARTQESGKSSDGMDEEDDEIAHFLIITKTWNRQGLNPELGIRQEQGPIVPLGSCLLR